MKALIDSIAAFILAEKARHHMPRFSLFTFAILDR
jgi:hypothetical protein